MTRRRIDAQRLAELVRGPGMDTRVHLALASVEDVCFDDTAGNQGVYADVRLIPGGEPETALVGSAYAGNGFGLWCPLKVDDVVLVAIPGGEPGFGPVIIARIWDSGDPPPSDMAGTVQSDGTKDPTEDVVLRVESGKHVKVRVAGAGTVDIKSEGSGNVIVEQAGTGDVILKVASGRVQLGNDNLTALDGVVHGSGIDPFTGATYVALNNASNVVRARRS